MSLDNVQAKYDLIKQYKTDIATLKTDKQTYITNNVAEWKAAIATVSTHQTAISNFDSQIEDKKRMIEELVKEIEQIFKDEILALRGGTP